MQRSTQEIRVTNKIIECGSDFWQISNVAHVSAQRIYLKADKPKYDINLITNCVIAEIIIILILVNIYQSRNIVFFLSTLIPIAVVVFSVRKTNELMKMYEIITNMKLFELVIQTNAGSKSLFRSTDEETIDEIRKAIGQAMSDSGNVISQVFNIKTIDVKDSIINLENEVKNQSIY
ncbi:DUF6232 family protein [Pseudanabaena sp. Chao 1811]|uniref:DUF6232 family protein n=1 Tax=Pseudanabaena sp. Chao 1811 TaxID=2963092 RepID=UPI0022F3BF14|nr:DUF6232 family protein [Pseudanabaena sp. Chao 1811]